MDVNIIEIKKNLDTILKRVSSYLPVIALIPTFMGGLWQALSLFNLGVGYIRFFSITQLLSDGILMLIILPIIWFLPVSMLFMVIKIKTHKKGLFNITLITIVTTIIFYSTYIIYYEIKQGGGIYKNFGFQDYLLFYILPAFIYVYFKISRSFFYPSSKNQKQSFINNSWWLFTKLIGGLGIILFLIATVRIFHNVGFKNSLPNKFVNMDYFESQMNEKYNLCIDNYRVAYFNDKYIFIEYHPYNDFPHFTPLNENYFKGILVLDFNELIPSKNYNFNLRARQF